MTDEVRLTKTGLLDRIRTTRAALDQLVAQTSEAQLTAPGADGWSAKDHLTHIAAWEGRLLALLNGRPAWEGLGITEAEARAHDIDGVNDLIYRRSNARPLADVLAEFRRSHQHLLAALETLSDVDLYRPYSHFQPNDPQYNPDPVIGWIAGNTFEHYEEHQAWMKALIGSTNM